MASVVLKKGVNVLKSDKEVSNSLCQYIIEVANKAISTSGQFSIGVSGGSAAKILCNGLPELTTDWSKWKIFLCDERHVPFDDGECTSKYFKENLLGKVSIKEENFFRHNPNVTVSQAAEEYEAKIKDVFQDSPSFDVLILGMGPDGHTCSLFPGSDTLKETKKWILPVTNSPKPPPERITMTLPLINKAKHILIASCGKGKAGILKEILEGGATGDKVLPAGLIAPSPGVLLWILDEEAASLLKDVK